jgi:hypothetical protein
MQFSGSAAEARRNIDEIQATYLTRTRPREASLACGELPHAVPVRNSLELGASPNEVGGGLMRDQSRELG